MQRDYKMFPPTVNWENIDWSTRRPQMDFPVQVFLSIINSFELFAHSSCLFRYICTFTDMIFNELMDIVFDGFCSLLFVLWRKKIQ